MTDHQDSFRASPHQTLRGHSKDVRTTLCISALFVTSTAIAKSVDTATGHDALWALLPVSRTCV